MIFSSLSFKSHKSLLSHAAFISHGPTLHIVVILEIIMADQFFLQNIDFDEMI